MKSQSMKTSCKAPISVILPILSLLIYCILQYALYEPVFRYRFLSVVSPKSLVVPILIGTVLPLITVIICFFGCRNKSYPVCWMSFLVLLIINVPLYIFLSLMPSFGMFASYTTDTKNVGVYDRAPSKILKQSGFDVFLPEDPGSASAVAMDYMYIYSDDFSCRFEIQVTYRYDEGYDTEIMRLQDLCGSSTSMPSAEYYDGLSANYTTDSETNTITYHIQYNVHEE